ncbi:Far upstream element-binding protein 2 [Spatholobus suberectus]|nr:Far upstream element-binding protein 2 [Spatholobus suberectus]
MNVVIAEAVDGDSPSLVARGLSPVQATVGSEKIQIQVPNEKYEKMTKISCFSWVHTPLSLFQVAS